jgi:hypothetical protein
MIIPRVGPIDRSNLAELSGFFAAMLFKGSIPALVTPFRAGKVD